MDAKKRAETVKALDEARIVFVAEELGAFLAKDIKPRESVVHPIIPTQGIALAYAYRGVGKTYVGLGIGYATSTGTSFLKWTAPKPRKVLYIDGEMPSAVMQERLAMIVSRASVEPEPGFFRLITPDSQPKGVPNLADKRHASVLEELIGDAELIIVDNISTLVHVAHGENDEQSWMPVQAWALQQRVKGRSVLVIHHAGQDRQTARDQ